MYVCVRVLYARRRTFDRKPGKWIVNNVVFICVLKTEIEIKK